MLMTGSTFSPRKSITCDVGETMYGVAFESAAGQFFFGDSVRQVVMRLQGPNEDWLLDIRSVGISDSHRLFAVSLSPYCLIFLV